MPNSLFYNAQAKGVTVNEARGGVRARANARGFVEADAADASLVEALAGQGFVRVDAEGEDEVLTAGTVQTATTCSAIFMFNGAASTVLNIRNLNGTGTLLVGPITIAANLERIIVFPTALAAAGGIFIDVDSGGLAATPGSLIP